VRVVYVVTAVRQAVAVQSNCGFGLVSCHLIFLNNPWWDYCLIVLAVVS
jgi:hypothetical protein